MLSFILSKMNLLIFATAVFVIALMMLSFTANIELKNITASNLNLNVQIIEEQLNNPSLCSYKSITIPDVLRFGLNNKSLLFYELKFSKIKEGEYTTLILSVNERGKTSILDARKIITDAEVILIDPGFIYTGDPIEHYFLDEDIETISLYPRAELKGDQVVAPNAFVALKRIVNNNEKIYIIPCSTAKKESPTNCLRNILRIGCYELKKESGTNILNNTQLHECFNISYQIDETQEFGSKYDWQRCKNEFGTQLQ